MCRAVSLIVLLISLALCTGCDDTGPDGDGDADSDADGDDCQCEPETDDCCCSDDFCNDGIFCNGTEICDRGQCESDPDAFLDPASGVYRISCDDGFDCTVDICDEDANLCVHQADDDVCVDDDLCDGSERCMPGIDGADAQGCVDGTPMDCSDDDPCTDNYCEDNTCRVRLRDVDSDSFGDSRCTLCDDSDPPNCVRGDDCDDSDDQIYPGNDEICDDGVDNNCDRVRDYADPDCDVPNDSCADALLLEQGVLVYSSTRDTVGDIDTSCDEADDPDVSFVFTIASEQDVEITVASRSSRALTVTLQGDCGVPTLDRKCSTGSDFTQIVRALAAGTYYVTVSSRSIADFSILLETSDPVARPDGDQCETALDVSTGGSFTGTTAGFDPDYSTVCGVSTDRDATFVFTLTETSAVDLAVTGSASFSVAVQSECGLLATERACFSHNPIDARVGSLAPGTYYIIVKSDDEVEFTLDIGYLPTSSDSCSDLRDISAGGTFFGTTADLEADIETVCGDEGEPDSAYVFDIATAQDVTVEFTSLGSEQTLSLTSVCNDESSEIACEAGESFTLRASGLAAGTYYLVATGTDGGDPFEIDVTFSDPTARPDGDTCATPATIEGDGTVTTVSTVGMSPDYTLPCADGSSVLYDTVLELDVPTDSMADITAEVASGTGTVALILEERCGLSPTQRGCISGEGSAEERIWTLPSGTYYLIVAHDAEDDVDVTVSLSPGDPGLYYVEEFSGTLTGWTLEGAWSLGIPSGMAGEPSPDDGACIAASHGGVTPSFMSYSTDYAQTPPIDLRDAIEPELTFRGWLEAAMWMVGGHVSVATDPDGPFTVVSGTPAYTRMIGGSMAWNGYLTSWQDFSIPLSSYAGEVIYIRFAMASEFADWELSQGWYVDTVFVTEGSE